MSKYITHLDVSTNQEEEQALQTAGFIKVNVDLNTGAGANKVYLWYKKDGATAPVTRIQVSFNLKMEDGLNRVGYTKISKNLNAGTAGNVLNMWYSRATSDYDTPIVDVSVTVDPQGEAEKLRMGGTWEEVSCNLNLGAGGNWVYVWMKREQQIYIREVTATDTYNSDIQLFTSGFTRVDVNTNSGAGASEVFLWYRKTTDISSSLSEMAISTNESQYDDIQQQGYEQVKVNLNDKTSGNEIYLWHKKETGPKTIKAMVLLLNINAVKIYEQVGVKVIKRSLNTGNQGDTIYLCYI